MAWMEYVEEHPAESGLAALGGAELENLIRAKFTLGMAYLQEDDEWLLGASLEHWLAQSLPEQ